MLALPGECWAQMCVYLDLRSLAALRATSHAVGVALKLAPLDCWVDLRCSAKGQRRVSPAGLRALRSMAGARLRSVDLHGCTQLSCAYLATSLLLEGADSGAIDELSFLGLGDVRLLSPRNTHPDPSHGMGHCLQLLAQRCTNLTRLDLSGCRAVDGHAIELLAACMDVGVPQLRWLAFDGCASSLAPARGAKTGGNHPLAPLARHAHKLCELGLSAFLHFNDEALDAVLLRPNIEKALAARAAEASVGVPRAEVTTAEAPVDTAMMRVLRLSNSRDLRLARSQNCFYLPHLVELDLAVCPRLGTEVFDWLLTAVPVLRRLNLSGCNSLRDAQVLAMFAHEAAQSCAAGLIDFNLGKKAFAFVV